MKRVTTWAGRKTAAYYRELDHPADLFLEIRGEDLTSLYENALFALYDQLAELEGVRAQEEFVIEAAAPGLADILRRLLVEALFRFYSEGFIGAAADVAFGEGEKVVARVYGERFDRRRHHLLIEIKAVTYHRLQVRRDEANGWVATVLFDV